MSNIAELLSARVPRYTSYPTAPHFHSGVDAEVYRRWLEELPRDLNLSLYVHIPFCDTLCWFCGCHTTVVNNYAPVASYLELLHRELSLVSDILAPGQIVSHIHWGGGSPTMLSPADVLRLGSVLRENFRFAPDAEFAIEIDPRGFRAEMANALTAAGVTRASIGVQDCDQTVQRAINRLQPIEVASETVSLLRRVGICALNVDLIYGLPHQTVAGIRHTIDNVLELEPDRVAIFGYAHVPHFKRHQKLIPESALPGAAERFVQAEAARERLCAAGYVAIGLDHFAKPGDSMAVAQREGRLARNFQGYTTDNSPALLGFGASAIGSLPQGYVQNLPDVPAYRAAILSGRLPAARGTALTTEDRVRRAVIERLMCDLSADLDVIARCWGMDSAMFSGSLKSLNHLVRDGIVSISGMRVTIAPRWRAATRLVCAAFDSYLDDGAGQHAVAV